MSIIVRMARMRAQSRLRGVFLLLIIAGAVLWVGTFRAFAQGSYCDHRLAVISRLAVQYGETVVAEEEFIGDEQRKLLLLRNAGTGSWTILAVWAANGMACFVAAGNGSVAPVRT